MTEIKDHPGTYCLIEFPRRSVTSVALRIANLKLLLAFIYLPPWYNVWFMKLFGDFKRL